MKKVMRKLKRVLDPYIGKYLDKFLWRFRHYIFSNWEEGYIDPPSLAHPHRELIINSIRGRGPVRDLLELGSGGGINLVTLSKHFPDISYTGIDINRKAINLGQKYIKSHNILDINLIAGDIFDINKMKSNSVDIILTDAVLMYLNPKDLSTLLPEMLRVSKLGFILCEQMSIGGVYNDHWRHDYEAMLNNLAGVRGFTTRKITEEYWSGDWVEFGFLIEVEKLASPSYRVNS